MDSSLHKQDFATRKYEGTLKVRGTSHMLKGREGRRSRGLVESEGVGLRCDCSQIFNKVLEVVRSGRVVEREVVVKSR